MLQLHVSLAAVSRRTLVLPPIHLPLEHRSQTDGGDNSLSADEVLDLAAFAPLTHVQSLRSWPAAPLLPRALFTFAELQHGKSSKRRMRSHHPAQLAAEPVPALVAALGLLRGEAACDDRDSARQRGRRRPQHACHGSGPSGDPSPAAAASAAAGGARSSVVAYCHLPSCRSRTRRACKRLRGGCTRTAPTRRK